MSTTTTTTTKEVLKSKRIILWMYNEEPVVVEKMPDTMPKNVWWIASDCIASSTIDEVWKKTDRQKKLMAVYESIQMFFPLFELHADTSKSDADKKLCLLIEAKQPLETDTNKQIIQISSLVQHFDTFNLERKDRVFLSVDTHTHRSEEMWPNYVLSSSSSLVSTTSGLSSSLVSTASGSSTASTSSILSSEEEKTKEKSCSCLSNIVTSDFTQSYDGFDGSYWTCPKCKRSIHDEDVKSSSSPIKVTFKNKFGFSQSTVTDS